MHELGRHLLAAVGKGNKKVHKLLMATTGKGNKRGIKLIAILTLHTCTIIHKILLVITSVIVRIF